MSPSNHSPTMKVTYMYLSFFNPQRLFQTWQYFHIKNFSPRGSLPFKHFSALFSTYGFARVFATFQKLFENFLILKKFPEMFSNRSSLSESRRPMMMICPSSGADVSADGEGYDHDDDVTETKRRKSKIELDR